ncbi:MAG: class I SAM-dependent methyltransferase [Pseudomonadota bacterium]
MKSIPEAEGRHAFGGNASGYHRSRPDYPAWVFDVLTREGVVGPRTATLEIGAGSGQATRKLIELGAAPLTLIEPDTRFASFLDEICATAGPDCRVIYEALEEADLTDSAFDLVFLATSFHWLNPQTRVQNLAAATRPGGYVVLVWQVFQDLYRPDLFHEATRELLAPLAASPSGQPDSLPFALDSAARIGEFLGSDLFELVLHAESHWALTLDAAGVRMLYEGFSGVSRLADEPRTRLLDQLEGIARRDFADVVTRNITTPLYVFRRAYSRDSDAA